ncbi:replication-associated protein [Sewage-associated circular DNA virus-15]|uniref:replication-associated protein n=1 Tax=Sewage-associated circular DNA virus-15 TaxID=1592082 RepID=UPI000585CE1D|nr:replication-associated protein [Sewage-associated circular DNA virus-15]AJD07522.1 replication-associated protein [Sewage-associated circular DNA virus-15]
MGDTSQRATCWSITINNPLPSDIPTAEALPAKWVLQGQLEEGKEGTVHYQGMLTTPQCRFSQVKKVLPRAHIEVAKNRTALEKYVHKEDTRLVEVPTVSSSLPTLFDYQFTVAGRWVSTEFDKYIDDFKDKDIGDVALLYVDSLVEKDIINGMRGIEFIAINPMWRSSWKRFWRGIILRHRSIEDAQARQEDIPSQEECTASPCSEAQDGECE